MAFFARLIVAALEFLPLLALATWGALTQIFTPENITALWAWYTGGDGWWVHTIQIVLGAWTLWSLWEAAIAGIRLWYHLQWSKYLVCLRVTQPRQETQKDRQEATEKDFREKIGVMEQLYRGIHEISDMNLWNMIRSHLFQTDVVSMELMCENQKVNFYVVTNKYYAGVAEKQITSFYPDAYVEPVEVPRLQLNGHKAKSYFFLQKNAKWRPIKTYKSIENDPLNSITNVLSKFKMEDQALMQVVLRPHTSRRWQKKARQSLYDEIQKKKKGFSIPGFGWLISLINVLVLGRDSALGDLTGTNAPGADQGDHFTQRDQATDENLKFAGQKLTQPGFDTTIRIVGMADTADDAVEITNGLTTAFAMFKNPFLNFLDNRRVIFIDAINNAWMLFAARHRLPALGISLIGERDCLMVPEELASIFYFPTSRYNYTPIIEWLKYKILPPPVVLPDPKDKENLILGTSNYRGEEKLISIKPKDRLRHFYVIGKSGAGKSALISYMARQDVERGDGLCVVDPHGDLVEDILKYVPKERAKDVIIFNPADVDRPMGLNLLEAHTTEEKDFASLAAMEIFIKLFGNEIFGPRLQHYFRNGCLTLMDDEEEGATIIDVPRLFTDEEFSQYKIKKIKNPVVKSFWDREMAKTGQREKEEMIPYFSAKFGPFVTNGMMRNIIGQPKSAFNFRQIMDERKILLVNLAKGAVGDINAQLLGLIFVNKMNMAAMSRVDVPEDQRPNFWLYVDEFQNFATDTFATILSEARKYHLGLIIAHQYIGQLTHMDGAEGSREDPRIRDAVFGNVGSMMSFKIGAADGEYMSKEYAPLLSEQDVINVANYSAYIKLNVDNTTGRPFSMKTIWDESGKNEKLAGLITEYSRMKYGRKKEFVDAEVRARVGIEIPTDDTEVAADAHADKAFQPLPNEMETQPIAGAPVEQVSADHVAKVEAAHVQKTENSIQNLEASPLPPQSIAPVQA